MSNDTVDTLRDALQAQRALSRWDNEGGAGPGRSQHEFGQHEPGSLRGGEWRQASQVERA